MEPVGSHTSPPLEVSVNVGADGDRLVPPTATEMQLCPVSPALGDTAAS